MALTDNLAVYYKLDETSGNGADSVGSNTMVISNATNASDGIINYCVSYSGNANSYSQITTNLGTLWDGNFSVSMWIKPTTLDGTNGDVLLYPGDRNGQFYIQGGSVFKMYMYDGSVKLTAGNTTPSNGNWYYVVFVRTGTSTGKIYVNGSDDTSATAVMGTGNTLTDTLRLACNTGNTAANFNGRIDEVGIWSRALSSTEVTTLYNGGAGLQYPFSSPSGPTNLKSLNTNLKANIKSVNTNLLANIKSINTNA